MSSLVGRYKNFRSKYVVQERRKHEYIFNRFYAHLIDPFLTKLVYDLKMTPNMVTILSGMMGVGAAVSFLLHQWILGAILLQLHHLFDGADGNLARLLNQCTPLGAKLDKICDQIVRFALFTSIAWVVDYPLWIKVLFVATIYIDVYIIHSFVLPFMKHNQIHRAKWKKWFLDRGIIPAFDIFTVFFLISLFACFGRLDILVLIVLVGKNLDWMYRVWECLKSKHITKREFTHAK